MRLPRRTGTLPSPTFTRTITGTSTKTATRTNTLTKSATVTKTPTWTATNTYTFTPTDTATATETPTATITPSVPEGESWKFYYYAGSARIAMRLKNLYGEQVYYFFSDHLGSTNMITDANGNITSETLYKAWGEIRYSSGSSPTDFTYTGQRSEMDDIGLIFYNARWYDPELGRFAQADTIVPDKENPIAQDRFAYGANNPISNTDPTGHCFFTGFDTAICIMIEMMATGALASYGIQVAGNMAEGTYGTDALGNVDTKQVVDADMFAPSIFLAPAIIGEGLGLFSQQMGLWANDPVVFAEGSAYSNAASEYINSLVLGLPKTAGEIITQTADSPDEFYINDWTDYPGNIPKPTGPFRLIQGDEYTASRQLADTTNKTIHFSDMN